MMLRLTVLFGAFIFLSAQVTYGVPGELLLFDPGDDKLSFTESLAEHVSGIILEKDPLTGDEEDLNSSVMWIPTYYGYHSFLGVLETFIQKYTNFTRLRTWRLADRNFYVIHLSQDDISIKIIYDSRESLLLLSLPLGWN
ncbi:MAG: hypothetical protein ACLFQA_01605 [Bacteroidales bacterium]